tara:strand:- start:29058 stop:29873 length:816 start_codon:yes stop_codon:yes gene_type:complete
MARIRSIKPEFWTDEDIALLESDTKLLALGLLNHSDDEGFFKAHEALVKAAVFPFSDDSVNIHGRIKQLENIHYLSLFTGTDGKQYGHIRNFNNHQKINRPSPSKIKPFKPITDNSLSNHGAITGGKEQGTGNREQGKERNLKPMSSKLDDDAQEVFDFWCSTMGKQKSAFSKARKKNVVDRLKEGYSVEEIKQAIVHCSTTPHNMGYNENRKVYDDLELICRSPEKLEQFRDNPGSLNASGHNQQNIEVFKRFLDEPEPEYNEHDLEPHS